MIRSLSVLSAVVLAITACSVTTAPSSDLITAIPGAEAVDLRNNSTETVYYFAADRGVLALLDFAVCRDPSKCESIAPGSTKRVPYAGIIGYSGTTAELVVYHWRLIAKGGGTFEQDSIRSMIVPLKE